MRSTAPALALLLGACCAVAANPAAAAVERIASLGSSAAVDSLLETAQQELDAGRPQRASTLLERALAIEPRNPTVWHYLGRARFDLGNYAQAAAMATKAHSLAGNDRTFRVSNAALMASALQSSGRTPSASERQVLAAPSLFNVGVERARSYVDTRGWRGQYDEPEPVRSRTRVEHGPQTWRGVTAWQQRAEAAARRAQAAAEQAEAAARRAEAEVRRYYRRYDSNESVIRRRQL